jgi:XRE family aerobic/anaerobic benzoate catabolism transcriptional regulator
MRSSPISADAPQSWDSSAGGVEGLQAMVGQRVRQAREQIGMSRRVLSEKSGVSPRYLAQLEAGQGNISIGLLHRVGCALGLGIETFFLEPKPGQVSGQEVERRFRLADGRTKEAVLRLLAGSDRDGRICLIGLRGAGKSTLGRLAAAKLGLPFLELNDEIASLGGMPVGEIVALYGQDGYRELEATALEKVIETHDKVLLAVAGGIVSEHVTFGELLRCFRTIWLKASPEEHMRRVRAQGDERPMANNPNAMSQLKSILKNREAAYARADFQLNTSGRSEAQSLQDLVRLVETGS